MANLNRYKFTFKQNLILYQQNTTIFYGRSGAGCQGKYKAIKEQMPAADDEVLAILLAINSYLPSSAAIEFDDMKKNWKAFRHKCQRMREKPAIIER